MPSRRETTIKIFYFNAKQVKPIWNKIQKFAGKPLGSATIGDGTTKIFLNADSDADDVSKELRDFLDYFAGKNVDSDYIREVDKAVKAGI